MKYILSVLVTVSVLVPASLVFAADSATITLQGGSVTLLQNTPFVEPGYTANSTVDGDITGLVTASPVNTGVPGNTTRSYSVVDSVGDTAFASRDVTVLSIGGAMPWCSGPMAPGYNVSLPGGGCGGTTSFVQFNHPLIEGGVCAFSSGCMVKR